MVDVLEQGDLPAHERLRLLDNVDPKVREIGEALINSSTTNLDPDVQDAVNAIRRWAEQTEVPEERPVNS